MEKFYAIIGNLKDESEDPYKTQQFIHQIYRELRTSKIKDKGKFKNRMGPEFEQWTSRLTEEYGIDTVSEIINDDEFWLEIMLITQRI